MKMKTLCALSMTALGLVFAAPDSACAAGGNNEPWDKVFAKSDKVDVKKVTFKITGQKMSWWEKIFSS